MNKTTLLSTAVASCFAASFAAAAFAAPANLESWSSCSATLCIDAPPQGKSGLDGSGGWGWDNKANAPVSTLTVGVPAIFTVTMLQPGSLPFNGHGPVTITLTYSSQDFSLATASSDGTVGTDPFSRGGVAVFTYADANFVQHTAQSVGFTFTPVNETKDALALVTATITVDGEQASATYPVAIKKK